MALRATSPSKHPLSTVNALMYANSQVGLLLQIRETVCGKGWGSAEEAQTMVDVRTHTYI